MFVGSPDGHLDPNNLLVAAPRIQHETLDRHPAQILLVLLAPAAPELVAGFLSPERTDERLTAHHRVDLLLEISRAGHRAWGDVTIEYAEALTTAMTAALAARSDPDPPRLTHRRALFTIAEDRITTL